MLLEVMNPEFAIELAKTIMFQAVALGTPFLLWEFEAETP